MSEKIFSSGSEWLRVDLHLHTRIDNKFRYNGKNFIEDYILALEKANIRIGAITNHNTFNCEEYIELKEEASKRGIWLLPGVELEVKEGANGIHVLLIFDDKDLERDKTFINHFISRQIDLQTKSPNKKLKELLTIL